MPLIVFVAVSLVDQADVIEEPGAKRSRQVPMFEYDARASVLVVAPTVRAFGGTCRRVVAGVRVRVARGDGDRDAVGDGSLDRGIDRRVRAATEAHVHDSRAAAACWPAAQSMPAMTPDQVPEPAAVQHPDGDEVDLPGDAVGRAADRAGDVRAVAVAVARDASSSTESQPVDARPPNCWWLMRMPVSTTYAVTPLPSRSYE